MARAAGRPAARSIPANGDAQCGQSSTDGSGIAIMLEMTEDPLHISSLVREHLSPADADTFLRLAKPAMSLRHTSSETPRGSHLGGAARLGQDQDWPTWREKALSLIAVLDLAELDGFVSDLELPHRGVLNLFYDTDVQPWGFDPSDVGGWRAVVSDAAIAVDRDAPIGSVRFSYVGLEAVRILSTPNWHEEAVSDIYSRDDDALIDLCEALDGIAASWGPRHQIGGWPTLQQDPFWDECQLASNGIYVGDPSGYADPRARSLLEGVDDWQLLAQIDSDDEAGWMWGDVGSLYYAIRGADLARTDLDRTWLVLQCG
jgi:uncharacterized protein YwqG